MLTRAFCLFDRKGGFYSAPFFFPAVGMAFRAATDLASDLNTTVGRHPADYDLYQVGVFDDASGTFAGGPPEFLVSCHALLESAQHPAPEQQP